MRFSRATVAAAAGVAALAIAVPSAVAAADNGSAVPSDSLRALAAKSGLRIGTAVDMSKLGTDATYTKIVDQQFSVVTAENVMKWDTTEPSDGTYNYAPGDKLVANAEANGQLVRGHTLLWNNQIPSWLTTGVNNGTISNAQLLDILHQHITSEVGHYKGKIWQWDVANEFIANSWDTPDADGFVSNNFWVQHLGDGVLEDAFRWAHEADPHALLMYNDYNITGEDGTNAKFQATYNMIKRLQSEGVPIDGVGEQGHLDTQYGFNPTVFQNDLKAYAGLGLKVAVTEADVRTFVNDAASQTPTDSLAQYAQPEEFSEELKGCELVSACISFTAWGVYDGDSWIPGTFSGEGDGLLYDVNEQPKPAYYALQSDLELAADAPKHNNNGNDGQ